MVEPKRVHIPLASDIGFEVGGHHERVVSEHAIHQGMVARRVVGREQTVVDRVERVLEAVGIDERVAATEAFGSSLLDLRRRHAENEDVVKTYCFRDLDVGSVHRADRERAVKRHLHVSGAGCLHAGSGNLLAEIGRRDDHLRQRHVVVRQKSNLEPIADVGVVVDDLGDVVGELDDQLGAMIARRRLSGEDLHARGIVAARVELDLPIKRGGREDVEQLALVLVDTLDLNVEERVR